MDKRQQRRQAAYLSTQGGIFDRPDARSEDARSKDVRHYAVKVTEAGEMLDAEFYPAWATPQARRAAKHNVTPEAQRRANARRTRQYISQLVHANFSVGDLAITLTFDPERACGSPTAKEVRAMLGVYFKAVRRYRKRHGLPPLKYIYVIEGGDFSPRERKRVHVHIIMSRMDRDEAEMLWGYGRVNTRRLQPRPGEGVTGLSAYMTKTLPDANPLRQKRWGRSKNLTEPTVSFPAHKLSRRSAARMLADTDEARARIEASFPGYRLAELEFYRSDFVGGIYVRARLFMWHAPAEEREKDKRLTDWYE